MYLNLLDGEEKKQFLGLAYCLARADLVFAEEEKTMLEAYCTEMQIEMPDLSQTTSFPFFAFALAQSCDLKKKKIIIFELLGLSLADGYCSQDEVGMIMELATGFGIDKNYVEKCKNLLGRHIESQQEINTLVLG